MTEKPAFKKLNLDVMVHEAGEDFGFGNYTSSASPKQPARKTKSTLLHLDSMVDDAVSSETNSFESPKQQPRTNEEILNHKPVRPLLNVAVLTDSGGQSELFRKPDSPKERKREKRRQTTGEIDERDLRKLHSVRSPERRKIMDSDGDADDSHSFSKSKSFHPRPIARLRRSYDGDFQTTSTEKISLDSVDQEENFFESYSLSKSASEKRVIREVHDVTFSNPKKHDQHAQLLIPQDSFCFGVFVTQKKYFLLDFLNCQVKGKKQNVRGFEYQLNLVLASEKVSEWFFSFKSLVDLQHFEQCLPSRPFKVRSSKTSLSTSEKSKFNNGFTFAKHAPTSAKSSDDLSHSDPFSFLSTASKRSSELALSFKHDNSSFRFLFTKNVVRERFQRYLEWHEPFPILKTYLVLDTLVHQLLSPNKCGTLDLPMTTLSLFRYSRQVESSFPPLTGGKECSYYDELTNLYLKRLEHHLKVSKSVDLEEIWFNLRQEPSSFESIVSNKLTIVFNVGTFMTKQSILYGAEIMAHAPDLMRYGVQVVVYGTGTPDVIERWKKRISWDFWPIFLSSKSLMSGEKTVRKELNLLLELANCDLPVSVSLFQVDYGYIYQSTNGFSYSALKKVILRYLSLQNDYWSLRFPVRSWNKRADEFTKLQSEIVNCPSFYEEGRRIVLLKIVKASLIPVSSMDQFQDYQLILCNDCLLVTQKQGKQFLYVCMFHFSKNQTIEFALVEQLQKSSKRSKHRSGSGGVTRKISKSQASSSSSSSLSSTKRSLGDSRENNAVKGSPSQDVVPELQSPRADRESKDSSAQPPALNALSEDGTHFNPHTTRPNRSRSGSGSKSPQRDPDLLGARRRLRSDTESPQSSDSPSSSYDSIPKMKNNRLSSEKPVHKRRGSDHTGATTDEAKDSQAYSSDSIFLQKSPSQKPYFHGSRSYDDISKKRIRYIDTKSDTNLLVSPYGRDPEKKNFLDIATLDVALSELSIDFLRPADDQVLETPSDSFWTISENGSPLLLVSGSEPESREFIVALKNEWQINSTKQEEEPLFAHRSFSFEPSSHEYEPKNIEEGIAWARPLLLGNKIKEEPFPKVGSRSFLAFSPIHGPIAILIENTTFKSTSKQAILVQHKGISAFTLPNIDRYQRLVDMTLSLEFPTPLQEVVFKEVSSESFVPALQITLAKLIERHFKFGILTCDQAGIVTEEQLYAHHGISSDFQEFLDLMATKTPLDGSVFSGGLCDAEYFYATEYEFNQIAFHVAPLIKDEEDDPSRKRHIGNDVSVIIFRSSPNQTINISSFRSKFNHIFIIVTKVIIDTEIYFDIEHVCKPGVQFFPPFFELNRVPKHRLRKVLLSKLINGERYAISKLSAFKGKEILRWNSLSDLLTQFGVESSHTSVFDKR